MSSTVLQTAITLLNAQHKRSFMPIEHHSTVELSDGHATDVLVYDTEHNLMKLLRLIVRVVDGKSVLTSAQPLNYDAPDGYADRSLAYELGAAARAFVRGEVRDDSESATSATNTGVFRPRHPQLIDRFEPIESGQKRVQHGDVAPYEPPYANVDWEALTRKAARAVASESIAPDYAIWSRQKSSIFAEMFKV